MNGPQARVEIVDVHARQALANWVVPDGQTAMISGFGILASPSRREQEVGDNRVVILIVPTLIDATGRWMHEK